MNIPTPRQVGLPHDEWWPGQLDAYLKAKAIDDSGGGFLFADAPTSTGKSAIATALGAHRPVLVLVQTLGLLDQYVREYGFAGVKGRQEYACSHPKKIEKWSRHNLIPKASDCHLENMGKCPYDCAYVHAKTNALRAMRSVCTYRYIAVSQAMQARGGILVLDEAHAAPHELFGQAQLEMTDMRRRMFSLPPFPAFTGYDVQGDILSLGARDQLRSWLAECVPLLSWTEDNDEFDPENVKVKKLQLRLRRALNELDGTNWFLQVGRALRRRGRLEHGLILRALDARPAAAKIWGSKQTVVLMSATIGNPEPLACELGIEKYQYECYPHRVPVEARPVSDLGVPRMTKTNLTKSPVLYTAQASAIWNWINRLDPSWRGLVLTSSYDKIKRLKAFLGPRLDGRLFQHGSRKVTERVTAFLTDPRQGLVAVDTIQGWGHGLDLRGDLGRFVVVAGLPFSNPRDAYVRARRKTHGGEKMYWWSAYAAVPQAAGRVSRGEQVDGEWLLNCAAIADGSATSPRALRHYPAWFREAMT